jgi:hypothetical protein
MKRLPLSAAGLFLLPGLAALSGCTPSTKPSAANVTPTKEAGKSTSRQVGLSLLREATDPGRLREALNLLNAAPPKDSQAALKLTDKQRKFFKESVGLSDEELQEVESVTFRPADAYYLAECYLLRDAARSQEIGGLSPSEQARRCFAWVGRNVLLHEQGEDWLPPANVLRRGYGGARDRALVFLALMRQLQTDGCVFVLPESGGEVILVGVLTSKDVLLFDPRLGLPVQSADGGVATLQEVRADPKLLAPSGLTADQLKAAEVRLACPLHGLSPRMRELERVLTAQDRIVLYQEAADLRARAAQAAGAPVMVWNAPPGPGGAVEPSPTRALRMLLPPDDGGTAKGDRLKRFEGQLIPFPLILIGLEQLKLRPQLAEPALAQLLQYAGELFQKYDLPVRDTLLRGGDVSKRLDRARSFLEDETLSGLSEDPNFQKAVAVWREKMNAAYGSLFGKEAKSQARVNELWAEDQYLLALLQVDDEDRPERYPKKTVTGILAVVAREPLAERAYWTRALGWQEKAGRELALAELKGGAVKSAAASTRSAWLNTRVAWGRYIDRAALGPAARRQRLEAVRAELKRPNVGPLFAGELLAQVHLDLHRYFAGRLEQAEAVYHVDGPKAAVALLKEMDEDLGSLLADGKEGTPGIKADVEDLLQRVRAVPAGPGTSGPALLARDWAAQGNWYWLRQHVRRRLEQMQK